MDLRRNLLALLGPYGLGAELLPGVRLDGASTELGMRLRFLTPDGVLWIDVAPVARMPRHASRTRRLAFAYRNEGGKSRIPSDLGLELCRTIAAIAEANEEKSFIEAPPFEHDGARVRHVDVEALLELTGPEGQTFYTLSPYVGCVIGCRFCYAQSKIAWMREVLGLRELPWGSYVDVRSNAPDVLARELESLEPRPIKFCPVVSDPYQAVERRERLTRRCLETIAAASQPWPVLVLTRSTMILDDMDRLAALPIAFAGVSLPTIDDEVRRHFEPRAASVQERLEILRALRSAGVRTLAVVQPMLAGPLERLADALAETVESVSIDVLHGVAGAEEDFADPRYAMTRKEAWQRDAALRLCELLGERGVVVWTAELPPPLQRS